MVDAHKKFYLSTVCAAVISAMGTNVYAQEEEASQEEAPVAEDVETISVQGFRGSLKKTINDKRFSSSIVDTINAEDIGKSTDQNIADALGRVTGVSIVSRDGEGAQVSIRGASSTQNNISLNGQQLSSTDFNQSVDLSSFSADILSKLEVFKTSSADQDEGSLGGSVNLITVRPLDVANDVVSVTAQGRFNELSEEYDHKLQFTTTKKFLDETLGFALSISDETNSYRKDQVIANTFRQSTDYRVATDWDGRIINNVRAIEPSGLDYRLNQNTSDRQGGSLGIQYLLGDVTELMFNATYSKQTRETNYTGLTVRFPGQENFVEGVVPLSDSTSLPAPFTDPQQDWYHVDTRTNSLVRRLDRFAVGDISRSDGGTENTNSAFSLNLTHEFTDNLFMSAQVGVSDSKSENLPNAFSNLQNFLQVPNQLIEQAGRNVQPVGVDCTSGQCIIVAGTELIDIGENIGNYDELQDDGSTINRPGWFDNSNVLTGFNPSDPNAFSLGSFTENAVTVEDTIKSAQVDFDYELYDYAITKIEFGAKVTSREKLVDDQEFTFNSITKSEPVQNNEGVVIGRPSGPLNNIRAVDILDPNGIGVSDFLDSLGIPRSGITQNPTIIDVRRAFDLVSDTDSLVRNVDNTDTRSTEIDTQAAYLKVNFALFDDRLTGDLGLRYVKTEIDTAGFSGGKFHDFPQHADESEFDWLTLKDLRDRSLPECPAATYIDPDNRLQYEEKFSRIDGTGWETNGSPDPADWTRIPLFDPNGDGIQDACHDANYADWADAQRNGTEYNGPAIGWQTMWRYADVTVTSDNGWDPTLTSPNVEWNGATDGRWANYTVLNTRDASLVSFPTAGSHSYTNVLPSLNLNYAISDELVGRFAISRTMTRPELEDTRAGFSFNQQWATYWGGGHRDDIGRGTVDLFNTQLEPLESDNLDLSLEWYFNPSSYVSIAYFQKDIINFVETESTINQYIADLRQVDGVFDPADLRLEATDSEADNFGLNNCSPVRTTTDLGFQGNDPLVISDDYRDLCLRHTINNKINGDSASIKGIELGYSQVYDFLPGWMSGLGATVNYTFQDSEYEQQESTVIPGRLLPSAPVADTPKHSFNATAFWEQDGHQVRLSYRATSDSLVGVDWNRGQDQRGRTWFGGSIWNEGRATLDLSMSYQINPDISVNFQAINLTDEEYRTYFTSRELEVDRVVDPETQAVSFQAFEEGNPLEGDAPTDRTYDRYKVGAIYRLGVRVNF